jgi:hypothetical protein
MACPACEDVTGTPTHVAPESQQITVTIHCGNCGHSWQLQTDQPLMILPKPDRRKLPRVRWREEANRAAKNFR